MREGRRRHGVRRRGGTVRRGGRARSHGWRTWGAGGGVITLLRATGYTECRQTVNITQRLHAFVLEIIHDFVEWLSGIRLIGFSVIGIPLLGVVWVVKIVRSWLGEEEQFRTLPGSKTHGTGNRSTERFAEEDEYLGETSKDDLPGRERPPRY